MPDFSILVVFGALIGGLINGLTGFGTGLAALPLWLQVLQPLAAAQLVIGCSVIAQTATLGGIWHAIDWRRMRAMLAGGLAGVPVGCWLVPLVDVVAFKRGIGLFIVGYTVVLLFAPGKVKFGGGWLSEAAIGFGGGVLSGLAGLSGVLVTAWAALGGGTKDERRGMIQGYNLPILVATLVSHLGQHGVASGVASAVLAAAPATLAGAAIGRWIYGRVGDARFERLVLVLLMASGGGLLIVR